MKYPLWNQKGEKIGEVTLPKEVFEQKMNETLVHQAAVTEQANRRIPVAHTKDRAEVRGGGVKPWRQKGTGRARAGSIRSPIWKGGGTTFGPRKERIFKKKINPKMRNKALTMILSSKVQDNELKVLDKLSVKEPKTKLMAEILKKINLEKSVLILPDQVDLNLIKACRNLPKVKVQLARQVTPLEVLNYKYLVLLKSSIKVLKERLS